MTRSNRTGYINQAMNVSRQTKSGTFTNEGIRGYEELMSVVADNDVTLTFKDSTAVTITLAANSHIAFVDVDSITSTGNVIIS